MRGTRKIIWLVAVSALLCVPAQSASIITRGANSAYAYGFMKNKPPASGYTGPGDIVAGAAAWYGLRAYNAAYAATTSKAVNLRRASDNTTCDFNVATSGSLGVSASGCSAGSGLSTSSFATTDATCTGTAAASTTLTVTSCSSTPHVGSTITGTGFSQPVYATAVSVAAGSGTITMNTAQTVTAASTTLTYGLYVTKLYDQSGNGCDVSQASTAAQPEFMSAGGAYTGALNNIMVFAGAQRLQSSSCTPPSNIISAYEWANVSTTILYTQAGVGNSQSFGVRLQFNSAGKLGFTFGGVADYTCGASVSVSANVWTQMFISITGNSGTGTCGAQAVGGSQSTGSSSVGTEFTTSLQYTLGGSASFLTGYMSESGFWSSAISSANMNSIYALH